MPLRSLRVTDLLGQWSSDRPEITDQIVQVLYAELKRIAARELRRERVDHTLQPTALVHEVYLRLREVQGVDWGNRNEFLGFAAHLMRRVLVEAARRKVAAKRGGGRVRVALAKVATVASHRQRELLAIDEALEALAAIDARKAVIVELRFFGGLSVAETATALEVSHETVGREWRRAKAWLYRELDSRAAHGR
jgi:RNA polymerase sigma factor (TIGR02999 family)